MVSQEKMEINENVSKLVKPSTPTPPTLRNYNISFFDEKQQNMNVPLILYYSTPHKKQNDIQTNIFNHLEVSLSKTLADFYPLAGRYMRYGSFIDCSDQGALYVKAKTNFKLSEFLGLESKPKLDMLQDFLPCEASKAGEIDDPLLSVKVTAFKCGGVAIGMCISHKFADMATFDTFINNWATRSREISNELELLENCSPLCSFTHLFRKTDILNDQTVLNSYGVNCVLRVFSFKGTAITNLRGKLMNDQDNIIQHRPSKVQLIVALLWKAFVDIDKANGQWKTSFLGQAVNLRNIVSHENFSGNFITVANARIELSEVINLKVLLKLLHESISKIKSDYARLISHLEKDYEVFSKPYLEVNENITNNDVNCYGFSSWCRFSFYSADFGWGKPVWRSITNMKIPNLVIMMDDEEGDGVEAWVHLDENLMCELEQDQILQAYMDN